MTSAVASSVAISSEPLRRYSIGIAGFVYGARHEAVEHGQAADGEVEEGSAMVGFNVRGEHARRRLRRAGGDGSRFEQPDVRAAARELPRHGAPDDSPANDDDIRGPGHIFGDTQS